MMEILVVIAIVTVLAGVLIVSAMALQSRGVEEGTKALMERIALAQGEYMNLHRMYVPVGATIDFGATASAPEAHSTLPLWAALEAGANLLPAEASTRTEGTRLASDTFAPWRWYYYIDRWNTPLRYECAAPWKSFRLTSAGKDLVFGSGDDIVVER